MATFYSPQTRFWELMLGSLLAYCFVPQQNPHINNLFSFTGILLIIFGLSLLTKENLFPGYWALFPTVGAALILAAGKNAWFNRVVLSNRVLVWFGLISFPLYLWHWPLLSFMRIMDSEMPALKVRIAIVGLSILLAWLTYTTVEKPIRFGKKSGLKSLVLIFSMCIIGFLGYNDFSRDGLAFRINKTSIQKNLELEVLPKAFFENSNCRKFYPNFKGIYCYLEKKSMRPTVLFLGDSHVNRSIMGVVELTKNTDDNILNLGHSGCLPFYNINAN